VASIISKPPNTISRTPPVIKTLPFGSRVAECPDRATVMLPVALNVPENCAITLEGWRAVPHRNRKTRTAW